MKKDLCLVFLCLESSEWLFQWLLSPKWGVFQSPLCCKCLMLSSSSYCFSTFSILFSCFKFPFFYHCVPLSLFPWCSSLSGFVELCRFVRIHCRWYFDWHSVHWLMFEIDLHPLLGADEVREDVLVAGHYHMCAVWRSLKHVCHCHSKGSSILFYLFFSFLLICFVILRSL